MTTPPTYTTDQLRPFLSDAFLAVLAEAARLSRATEAHAEDARAADIEPCVTWCHTLAQRRYDG